MPRPAREHNEYVQDSMPLLIVGVALVVSSRYYTVIDDEVAVLDAAAQPLRHTASLFLHGNGQHEHPPLFDFLLHFWLRATGGNFEYLRVFPILLYLIGLFFLVRVARRLGGPHAALATAWVSVLWPFGFHYARLVVWYSFAFLIIAALTLSYLRYLESPTRGRWAVFFALGAALLWTNYFGWAVLACLAIDQWLRKRAGESGIAPKILAGTAVLWAVAFLPLIRAFGFVLTFGTHRQRLLTIVANAAFNVYSLFVSEAVAPWYWTLSIPAGVAILVAMALVYRGAPPAGRRFLWYSAALIVVMALTGILLTRRLFLVAPWVLLPIGVAIATKASRWTKAVMALALLGFAGIGWYGTYDRHHYSAPRFLEPWLEVAGEADLNLQSGQAGVVANSPSFFLYLTYLLHVPPSPNWAFVGALPVTVQTPRVFAPDQWIEAGHPFSATMFWIRGMDGPQTGGGDMDDAAKELDHECGARTSRLLMRDEGYPWKQRFFPELGELPWRIEIREYDCAAPGAQGSATPGSSAPPTPPIGPSPAPNVSK